MENIYTKWNIAHTVPIDATNKEANKMEQKAYQTLGSAIPICEYVETC